MKVGLFIPCYVDQFYPQVGVATLKLLERLGVDVEYPMEQTCCGQPMANTGHEDKAHELHLNFLNTFKNYDYVVMPSGSCTLHVKEHMPELKDSEEGQHLSENTYDLIEFIHDVLGNPTIKSSFPYKTGLHIGCHGLRGLRLASGSERKVERFNKVESILSNVQNIEFVHPPRQDECCGFGGTFSVFEEAVSVQMGKDKLQNYLSVGTEVIATPDMSCALHLEGIAKKEKMNIRFVHIAEVLMHHES